MQTITVKFTWPLTWSWTIHNYSVLWIVNLWFGGPKKLRLKACPTCFSRGWWRRAACSELDLYLQNWSVFKLFTTPKSSKLPLPFKIRYHLFISFYVMFIWESDTALENDVTMSFWNDRTTDYWLSPAKSPGLGYVGTIIGFWSMPISNNLYPRVTNITMKNHHFDR